MTARSAAAEKIVVAFENYEVLPGSGLPPPTVIYKTYIAEIASSLSPHHLSRLTVVYGGVSSIHEILEGSEGALARLMTTTNADRAHDVMAVRIRECVDYLRALVPVAYDFLNNSSTPFSYQKSMPVMD